ncbi:hypothetical protein COY95_03375 [Candidatus Woesearchaeota archaeon CG_4_10_14_0_8_um_filter_47_5]|nr:MAG: hypothetical protein COY95_03375 [Candidatus Woesearchaeota archaeon CG_4_10_14_0_8_um_filter_47_5]
MTKKIVLNILNQFIKTDDDDLKRLLEKFSKEELIEFLIVLMRDYSHFRVNVIGFLQDHDVKPEDLLKLFDGS